MYSLRLLSLVSEFTHVFFTYMCSPSCVCLESLLFFSLLAVRFEPGDIKTVGLVSIGGGKIVLGGNNLCDGPINPANLPAVMAKVVAEGFGHAPEEGLLALKGREASGNGGGGGGGGDGPPAKRPKAVANQVPRAAYAKMYGPTVGDCVRLGDTSLWVRVEKDATVYGDECKFGGGKTLRDGMGQATGRSSDQGERREG